MTTTGVASASPDVRAPLSREALTERRAQALTRFCGATDRALDASASTVEALGRSREMHLDASRQREVILRQRQALAERTAARVANASSVLRDSPDRRVVIAHRNAWFRDKVAALLAEDGIRVDASVDNGADAVGLAVAEQPDLLLIEDRLVMLRGEEVIREALRYCPATMIAAHVSLDAQIEPMLAAGAGAVFTRQVPPVVVARELAHLLR